MKIDLHVHTSEISRCGLMTAEETIRRYRDAGYGAIVIANHFNPWTARGLAEQGRLDSDFTSCYFRTVRMAKEIGKTYGVIVFPGMEMNFENDRNDYLVYGMPESAVKDVDSMFQMGFPEFSKLAAAENALIYQAHPFRNGMTVTDPSLLFGIEVMNCNPRHDGRNDIAEQWALRHHLHQIGGSDCHRVEDVGTAGIITDRPVENLEDLIQILRNDEYRVFGSGAKE